MVLLIRNVRLLPAPGLINGQKSGLFCLHWKSLNDVEPAGQGYKIRRRCLEQLWSIKELVVRRADAMKLERIVMKMFDIYNKKWKSLKNITLSLLTCQVANYWSQTKSWYVHNATLVFLIDSYFMLYLQWLRKQNFVARTYVCIKEMVHDLVYSIELWMHVGGRESTKKWKKLFEAMAERG